LTKVHSHVSSIPGDRDTLKSDEAMLLTEALEDAFVNPSYEHLNLGTRALGALQVSGGGAQMVAAPVCGPLAPFVGLMGVDNVVAGLQTMLTGEPHSTLLFHGLSKIGESTGLYGQPGASYIEMGLNLGIVVNPVTVGVLGSEAKLLYDVTKSAVKSRFGIPKPTPKVFDVLGARESLSEVALVKKALEKAESKIAAQQGSKPLMFSEGVSSGASKARPVPAQKSAPTAGSSSAVKPTPSYDLHKKLTSKSLNELAKPIDEALVKRMEKKGWTVVITKEGSEEFKYLNSIGAEASISSGHPRHIIIREGATKSCLLEEYLHETQVKLGLLEKYGSYQELEIHVKDFMLRHVKMLGLDNPNDISLLQKLKVEEMARLKRSNI